MTCLEFKTSRQVVAQRIQRQSSFAINARSAITSRSPANVACRGLGRSLTSGNAGLIRSYSETFGSSGKRVTLARLVSGISDCAKASIGEYFAPEFERQCGLFLREVVAA